jgi:Dolichyl-phosphate-mannose-protein mannosyltransferase
VIRTVTGFAASRPSAARRAAASAYHDVLTGDIADGGLASHVISRARRHWLFVVLLVTGASVRALAMVAYPPALFFGDSWGYVADAFSGAHLSGLSPVGISNLRPNGYPTLIWLLTMPGRDVVQLVAIQHLAGMAIGALVYAALVRAGVLRAVAAAAAALVLLDGYAITLEQYVMPDTFFSLTVLLGTLSLAWPALRSTSASERGVGARRAATAGVLLAGAAIQRPEGLFVVPVFVAYLVWRRVGCRALAAFAVALAVPVLAYASAEDVAYGTFAVTQTSGWNAYGRVAGFADCAGAGIALAARPLCETAAQRSSHPDDPSWYVWFAHSPAVRLFGGPEGGGPSPGHSNAMLGAFARQIVLNQPLDVLTAVSGDVLRYFTPGATPFLDARSATSLPASAEDEWVFPNVRRRYLPAVHPRVRSPATLVRAYRRVIHVPRPLLALLALASLAALALRVPIRREVLLLSGSGLALIVGTAATAGFGLRYLLPAVPLLAIGGTLALRDARRVGAPAGLKPTRRRRRGRRARRRAAAR